LGETKRQQEMRQEETKRGEKDNETRPQQERQEEKTRRDGRMRITSRNTEKPRKTALEKSRMLCVCPPSVNEAAEKLKLCVCREEAKR